MLAGNVLELPVVRFETVVYRNATNKDTMFMDFCKAKITVFRGATAFAKALLSARITGRCCYTVGVFFSAVSLNTAFVSADKRVTITKLHLY